MIIIPIILERFPSPIGESYFSIIIENANEQERAGVSVPYRGILFFNANYLARVNRLKFPSPIGESYFSIPLPHLPVPQGCQGTLRGKEIFHGILSIYSCSISAKALIYGLRPKTSFFPVFCRYIIPSEQFFHDNVYTSIYVEIHHI